MKFSKPILVSIAFLANAALMSAVLTAGLRQVPTESSAGQDKFPKEQLHGVLSSARLTPPLRGLPSQVRFSSDGDYLLVQLESGIYILNRRPLEVRTWIHAPDVLSARFSADSKTLILATRSLAITRWNLADNQRVDERILKKPDDLCIASELSPNGDLAVCLDPSLALELYRTDTGERVLGEQVFTDQAKLAAGLVSVGLIPRNQGTPYAEPFGYGVSYRLELLAEREVLFGPRFIFSPDAHFLLMLDRPHRSAVCVDVGARRKIGCPGIIKDHWNATVCFVERNEIAVVDPDNPEESQITEFPGGQFVTKLHLAARVATPATQSKYLIVRGSDKKDEVRLFDWDAGRTLKTQEEAQMDVTEQTLATYSRQGELKLVHVPDDKLEAETILPPPLLANLRTANVSPNLDAIVLGIRRDAGLFRTATGNQVMHFTRLSGAWFAKDDELYSMEWRENGSPVPYADPQGERVALGWRATMSGGQALAKRYPALKRQLDAVKLTITDAVFEVLEAVSGKSVGTALVRVGWGPESFDSVFSVGDFLICVRDRARVTEYSLSTGEIQARLFGHYVSASATTGLLAAADGNHLRLYNLKSGRNIDEYLFPDAPVYTRFSIAGNRLLVLTAQQFAYVIDVDALTSSDGGAGVCSVALTGLEPMFLP